MDNAIFPNKFKAALAAHQVQIGCWCALANPISTEVLGLAGFDWLVLDAEHAPNDVTTLIPQLMALKGSSSAQVVRVPTNEPIIIKRMLDIGFYNFDPLSAGRDPRGLRFPPRQYVWHRAGLLRPVQQEHFHSGAD